MAVDHGLESLCEPAQGLAPELIIDVSNVCRNRGLGESGETATWGRLLAVLDEWNRWEYGFERPVVRLVADESLRRALSPEDRQALKRAEADGYAEVLAYADPVILDLAERHGCAVLSNDQFVGHRRERPWLDGNADRFIQADGNGHQVELRLVQLSLRSDYSVSRAEEGDELKARHIDLKRGIGADLLEWVYRCDNRDCGRQAFAIEGAVTPPERAPDGSAACPGCGRPLTRVGTYVDTAIVKLTPVRSDADPIRIPVAHGASVLIGRTSPAFSLKVLLPADEFSRISRDHADVSFNGHCIALTDHGSSNGTSIERWLRAEKAYGDPERLVPNVTVHMRSRDRAVLGGVLILERSGRRFPFDLGAPVVASDHSSVPATVAQTGEER